MALPLMAPPMGMPMAPPDPLAIAEMLAMGPELPEIAEPDEPIGPELPIGWKRPPKPKIEDILEDAQGEKSDHAARVSMAATMIRKLSQESAGIFERDVEDVANGEVEEFWSTALRDEHDLAVARISDMDLAFEALYHPSIDKDEAAAKEDLLHYLMENRRRQHANAGGGDIDVALIDLAQKYAMLVGFAAIDPLNAECGLTMRILDPATCFPVFGGARGLQAMYRVYDAEASEVIGNFGDADGKVERKVRKLAKTDGGRYNRHYTAEVVEYWDTHWALIAYGSEEIAVWEHGYGFVPFIVETGGFAQQPGTTLPDAGVLSVYNISGGGTYVSGGTGSSRADDLARIYEPFLWRRLKSHRIAEAVNGRLLTMLRRSMNPPQVHAQTLVSATQNGDAELDPREGAITKIGEGDKLTPLQNLPAPEIVAPLMAAIEANRMTGSPASVLSGQGPGAQTSGSALDILSANGETRWLPLVRMRENFETRYAELILTELRDWMPLLGVDGERGTLPVPKRNPRTGTATAHEVTRDLLQRTGTRVKATLHHFDPMSLGPLANGLMQLSSMGLIDKRSAIDILGYTTDPEGVLQRLREQQLDEVPEIIQANMLVMLRDHAQDALDRGDQKSARELLAKAKYIADQIMMRQMMTPGFNTAMNGPSGSRPKGQEPPIPGIPGGGPPVPEGAALPPGVPMPPPAPEAGPGYQGASLPQYGIPTGTNGGRPPGRAVG